MENYNIVNENISSDIKEKLTLEKISHNMLVDDKHIDEFNLIYKKITNFIGQF
tara:strand:- start:424 stop:582 length:159 start_codon:yes stop_codon:yes gene_type:complete